MFVGLYFIYNYIKANGVSKKSKNKTLELPNYEDACKMTRMEMPPHYKI